VRSASVIQQCTRETDINALVGELSIQIEKMHSGDLSRAEEMLLTQAHTLDALFANLTRRALGSEYMEHLKAYMSLGMKAQSQCRMTLEALAEIKNPQPYIQNNKAQYQQINNGQAHNKATNTRAHTQAENLEKPNELLEDTSREQEWMDTTTPQAAIRANQDMATVDT
ncbi:MAG: hypothetical protein JKY87_01435, partial [Mariprofundus sp.]|nr:hypothetical protein [Mariprofundus sp.]